MGTRTSTRSRADKAGLLADAFKVKEMQAACRRTVSPQLPTGSGL
jgi:hypothetical protein